MQTRHFTDPTSTSATAGDPVRAALIDALADLRTRYRRALIVGGTDPDFADAAVEKADAALALARGEPPDTAAP